MSHKIKSFKEWQRKRNQKEPYRGMGNPDPQKLYEEIRNMVCTAFSRYDTDAVMAKVEEYGFAKFTQGTKTLARKLTERL